MDHEQLLGLDPVIHAPVRLAVMSILVGVEEADFAYLKQATHASDGNLSTHLTRLETAGLVTIKKGFRGKKPRTTCSITAKGRISFREYLSRMEQIVGLRGRS